MGILARSVPLAAWLAVAGCAGQPVQTGRTVPADPARAQRAVEAELRSLGFVGIRLRPGMVEATAGNVPSAWAACPPVLVGDGDDRRRMASPSRRQAVARVTIVPGAGGAAVTVATSFGATYRNGFSGNGFERACRSQGIIESRLLAAAGR
jgi:hypothetical protein